MIKIICSILDKKAQIYNTPFTSQSEIFASREMIQAMQKDDISLSLYPEDYDLYEIGKIDDVTGVIEPTTPPKFILSAISAK